MRLCFVGAALLFSIVTTGAAQSRWTLSAGPEWSTGWNHPYRAWGMRIRAEYDLTKPNRMFALRFESGALWSPTQTYFRQDGSGTEQMFDVVVGLNASLSPMPRAPVSPYVTLGIFGRQQWVQGSRFPANASFSSIPGNRGAIAGALGVGLRIRLGGQAFQLEYRRLYNHTGLTFGTRIPF
jgi:hypothetical protein